MCESPTVGSEHTRYTLPSSEKQAYRSTVKAAFYDPYLRLLSTFRPTFSY